MGRVRRFQRAAVKLDSEQKVALGGFHVYGELSIASSTCNPQFYSFARKKVKTKSRTFDQANIWVKSIWQAQGQEIFLVALILFKQYS